MSNLASYTDRIVVVDDEPAIREMLQRYLGRHGYEVRTAATASDALSLVETFNPVALISDILMPGTDGFELLGHVIDADPDIVVILTTGEPDVPTAVEALRAGASDFLPKPIEVAALLEALERGIARRLARVASRARQFELENQVRLRTAELTRALNNLRAAHKQLQESYEESIELLRVTSSLRDLDTGNHIDRIRLFSRKVGERLGLEEEDLHLLEMASPLHDIGKIGIPDSILQKRGPLTVDEFEIMKTHTTIGAQIMSGREAPLFRTCRDIALTHHERWDGLGYPRGLRRTDIPLFGRIVSVVDVFDALVHERCYKEAYNLDQAIEYLSAGRESKFDPEVLDAFLDGLPEILEIMREIDGVDLGAFGGSEEHESGGESELTAS